MDLLVMLYKHLPMPFRRSSRGGNFLRPVHSIKHIVDIQGAEGLNTKEVQNLILAVDAPVLANTTEVETGSKVFGIFLNIQVVATTEAALPNIYFIIYKIPGANISAGNIPNGNVTGASDFKRQIFHTEMAMMTNSANTQVPITLFKGVIKIPKVFSTMRINDIIQMQLFAPGVNFEFCIETIYKEFR